MQLDKERETHPNFIHERTLGGFYFSYVILKSLDSSPKHTFRKSFRFITAFCLAVKDLCCYLPSCSCRILCFPVSNSLDTSNKYGISIAEIWIQHYQEHTSTAILFKVTFLRLDTVSEKKTFQKYSVFRMLYITLTGKLLYQRLQTYEKQVSILIKLSSKILESCDRHSNTESWLKPLLSA